MVLETVLSDGAPLPRRAKKGDAGLDLTSRETVTLAPGETRTVDTGVSVAIPEGYVGLVFPRSGLGSRGVNLSNCVGVIDSGYRGSIKAPLHNNRPLHEAVESAVEDDLPVTYTRLNGDGWMTVEKGERVCQLVIVPFATVECVEVEELDSTERGEGGFGSSGRGDFDA